MDNLPQGSGNGSQITIKASAIRAPDVGTVFAAAIMTWDADPDQQAFVSDILPGGGDRENYVTADDGVTFIALRCLDRLFLPCSVTLLTDVDFSSGIRVLQIALGHIKPNREDRDALKDRKMRLSVAGQLAQAIGAKTIPGENRFFVRRVPREGATTPADVATIHDFSVIHGYLRECREKPPVLFG